MKIQEVILRALSGEIHWFQPAEILGLSAGGRGAQEAGGSRTIRPSRDSGCSSCNTTGAQVETPVTASERAP